MSNEIEGYRDLSQDEIDIVNKIKSVSISVGALCDVLKKTEGVDQRWVGIATADLQKGFMSLVRSVTKPETF
jgi:hypothetical protein